MNGENEPIVNTPVEPDEPKTDTPDVVVENAEAVEVAPSGADQVSDDTPGVDDVEESEEAPTDG